MSLKAGRGGASSGSGLFGLVEELKEFCRGLLKAAGGLIIAASIGNFIELLDGDVWLGVALRLSGDFSFWYGVIMSC